MEARHGTFEGKTEDEYHEDPHYLKRKEIKDPAFKFRTSFGPPDSGAENSAQVYERVKQFFEDEVVQCPQSVHIVVCHGTPIRSIGKMASRDFHSFEKIKYAEVVPVTYNIKEKKFTIP